MTFTPSPAVQAQPSDAVGVTPSAPGSPQQALGALLVRCDDAAADGSEAVPIGEVYALVTRALSAVEKDRQSRMALVEKYEALELPLEQLVELCNNVDSVSVSDEVIAAEAALERLYRARRATPSASHPAPPTKDQP